MIAGQYRALSMLEAGSVVEYRNAAASVGSSIAHLFRKPAWRGNCGSGRPQWRGSVLPPWQGNVRRSSRFIDVLISSTGPLDSHDQGPEMHGTARYDPLTHYSSLPSSGRSRPAAPRSAKTASRASREIGSLRMPRKSPVPSDFSPGTTPAGWSSLPPEPLVSASPAAERIGTPSLPASGAALPLVYAVPLASDGRSIGRKARPFTETEETAGV